MISTSTIVPGLSRHGIIEFVNGLRIPPRPIGAQPLVLEFRANLIMGPSSVPTANVIMDPGSKASNYGRLSFGIVSNDEHLSESKPQVNRATPRVNFDPSPS